MWEEEKCAQKKKNMEVTTLETLASKERVVYVLNKALHHEDIVEKVYRSTFSWHQYKLDIADSFMPQPFYPLGKSYSYTG